MSSYVNVETRMNKMTKKLPQLQQYRPYKYNEVRRKFRMSTDASKDIDSIKEEEFNKRILRHHNMAQPTTERETSNLLKSRSNLGVSRENLGASQDSLNKENTLINIYGGSHENLRADLQQKQTTLDELKKREVDGRNVYSFSLQKADRSYSEPMIFPPLNERNKSKASHPAPQQQVSQSNDNTVNKSQDIHLHRLAYNKENTLNLPTDRSSKKPPTGIKFPLVTRADLYKHLGISQDGRQKKKKLEPGEKISKEDYQARYKTSQRIIGDSGNSRTGPYIYNPYGKGPEQMAKNKVEMYKQWHEEQSKQKIKRGVLAETARDAVKLASVYREKYNASDVKNRNPRAHRNREGTLPKIGVRNSIQNERLMRSNAPSRADLSVVQGGGGGGGGGRSTAIQEPRPESPPTSIPEVFLNIKYSEKSWHTWRDINESYSYTDVQEYIEDNELMDEEKADWIRQWIIEVDRRFFNPSVDSDRQEVEEEDTDECKTNHSEVTQYTGSYKDRSLNGAEQADIIVEKAEAITKI